MLSQRQLDILQFIGTCKLVSREHVQETFFEDRHFAVNRTNEALRKLVQYGYIETRERGRRETNVYRLTKDTAKELGFNYEKAATFRHANVEHALAVTDIYVSVSKRQKPKFFYTEKQFSFELDGERHYYKPDAFMEWQDTYYYVEAQLSRLSKREWENKWQLARLYKEYIEAQGVKRFPSIFLVTNEDEKHFKTESASKLKFAWLTWRDLPISVVAKSRTWLLEG